MNANIFTTPAPALCREEAPKEWSHTYRRERLVRPWVAFAAKALAAAAAFYAGLYLMLDLDRIAAILGSAIGIL